MQQLDLLSWVPPRKVIAFPLVHRVGRIRDVAEKLGSKQTQRHADYYCKQVSEGLAVHLAKIGVPAAEIDRQIDQFWEQVELEILRQTYGSSSGGGNRGGAA
jgi:energy-coupling factor transporter ATP-binding protein EcfA2